MQMLKESDAQKADLESCFSELKEKMTPGRMTDKEFEEMASKSAT